MPGRTETIGTLATIASLAVGFDSRQARVALCIASLGGQRVFPFVHWSD